MGVKRIQTGNAGKGALQEGTCLPMSYRPQGSTLVYTELSDQSGLEQDCLEAGNDIFTVSWLGVPALLKWAESTEIV